MSFILRVIEFLYQNNIGWRFFPFIEKESKKNPASICICTFLQLVDRNKIDNSVRYDYEISAIPFKFYKILNCIFLRDQLLLAPLHILAIFYLSGRLNGKSIRQSRDDIQTKFKRVYITDWMARPAAKLIHFNYLPPRRTEPCWSPIEFLGEVFRDAGEMSWPVRGEPKNYMKEKKFLDRNIVDKNSDAIILWRCLSICTSYLARNDFIYFDLSLVKG